MNQLSELVSSQVSLKLYQRKYNTSRCTIKSSNAINLSILYTLSVLDEQTHVIKYVLNSKFS